MPEQTSNTILYTSSSYVVVAAAIVVIVIVVVVCGIRQREQRKLRHDLHQPCTMYKKWITSCSLIDADKPLPSSSSAQGKHAANLRSTYTSWQASPRPGVRPHTCCHQSLSSFCFSACWNTAYDGDEESASAVGFGGTPTLPKISLLNTDATGRSRIVVSMHLKSISCTGSWRVRPKSNAISEPSIYKLSPRAARQERYRQYVNEPKWIRLYMGSMMLMWPCKCEHLDYEHMHHAYKPK